MKGSDEISDLTPCEARCEMFIAAWEAMRSAKAAAVANEREMFTALSKATQRLADAHLAIEEAFREGFRSPVTYNDTVLNDEDEEWKYSLARRHLYHKEPLE